MALAAARFIHISDQVHKLRPILLARANEGYALALGEGVARNLIPHASAAETTPSAIAASFGEDIKSLTDSTDTWFSGIFWKEKIARTGEATLRGAATEIIDCIIKYIDEALTKQGLLPRFLQATGIQAKKNAALSHFYFFILGQIVTAANAEYRAAQARLKELISFLRASTATTGATVGDPRTTFINHTNEIIGYIEVYLIKLTMVSEQQTYAKLLSKMQGSAKESVELLIEELMMGMTAAPLDRRMNLQTFLTCVKKKKAPYTDIALKTGPGALLYALCLQPDIWPVLTSIHAPPTPPSTFVLQHLSNPAMRSALIDPDQTFDPHPETEETPKDSLYPFFGKGHSLQSAASNLSIWRDISIFWRLGKSEKATRFSTDLLHAFLDILERIRDLSAIHYLIQESIGSASLLGDTLIRSWEFSLLMMGVIEEVCSDVSRSLLEASTRFYDILQHLPSFVSDTKSQYNQIVSNQAYLTQVHAETQARLMALQENAAELQQRTASITQRRVREAVEKLKIVAQGFARIAERRGLHTERLALMNKLLEQSDAIDLHSLPIKLPEDLGKECAAASPPQALPSITIAAGTSYPVNIAYEYEDQDVTYILELSLARTIRSLGMDHPPIYALAAVDTISSGRQLIERLTQDQAAHAGRHISLIPCNIGNYHWVGLLFEMNDSAECIRAEFINSISSPVPLTLQNQFMALYPRMTFTVREDLIKQGLDGTSCGVCMIESLLLSACRLTAPAMTNLLLLRAQHLALLEDSINAPDIEPREEERRRSFFLAFNARQQSGQPSFNSSHLPVFRESPPKSEAEMLALVTKASLILAMPPPISAELRAAFRTEGSHKDVLDALRTVLWKYGDEPHVQQLSFELFGVKKDSKTNTAKKYAEHSNLLFEYAYLEDILNLISLNQDEFSAFKDLKGLASRTPLLHSSPATPSMYSTPPSSVRTAPELHSPPRPPFHTRRGSGSKESDGASVTSWLQSTVIGIGRRLSGTPSHPESTGGVIEPEITPTMDSAEKVLRIVFNKDMLEVISNAHHLPTRTSRLQSGWEARAKAKAELVALIQTIENIKKEIPLTLSSFETCNLTELSALTFLIFKICRNSQCIDKKAAGAAVEERLKKYFDFDFTANNVTLTLTPKKSNTETSFNSTGDSPPLYIGPPAIAEDSVDSGGMTHSPPDMAVVACPNFDQIIQETKHAYVPRRLKGSPDIANNLLKELTHQSSQIEQMALFASYILCRFGSNLDAGSFRVMMLADICSHRGLPCTIRKNRPASPEAIFGVLCHLILLHIGLSPLQENENELISFLSSLIINCLSFASEFRWTINKEQMVRVIVKCLIEAPIFLTDTPIPLHQAIQELPPADHHHILEVLHGRLRLHSTTLQTSSTPLRRLLAGNPTIYDFAAYNPRLYSTIRCTLTGSGGMSSRTNREEEDEKPVTETASARMSASQL